jgi:hypothetical protein
MIGIIDRLMKGDTRIAERFAKSQRFWDDFHAAHRRDDEAALAHAIGGAQGSFEMLWDWDRYTSKSAMPYTAVAALYDNDHGFGDNRGYAARVLRAFQRDDCMCSVEVKGYAEDAAALYHPEG